MPDRSDTGTPAAPPERVTVLTCSGCGAMGREERCGGDCSSHKLVLVRAEDHQELLAARARAAGLAAMVGELAAADAVPVRTQEAWFGLRDRVRLALAEGRDDGADARTWTEPETVTGWWCARCGNVDMPRPCLSMCDWRPAEWVALVRYEADRRSAEAGLRAGFAHRRFLARVAAVTPREGQWERNREAVRARALLELATVAPREVVKEGVAG